MAKWTKAQTRQLAEELLNIRSIYERYQAAEKELKIAMVQLKMDEISIDGRGRVFISESETTTIEPDLAWSVLGDLAVKVIEIKESVSNRLISALVATGDISPEAYERLDAGAKKTPRVSLYVRPLN